MRRAVHPALSSRDVLKHTEEATSRATPNSSPAQNFFIDRKGDLANIQYGSLDQHKIPRYRHAGYGRLIGLDRRFRVSSTSEITRHVDDDSVDSTRKHRPKSLLEATSTKDRDGMQVVPVIDDNSFVGQRDYIKLSHSGGFEGELSSEMPENFDDGNNDGDDDVARPAPHGPVLIDQKHSPSQSGLHDSIADASFEHFRDHSITKRNNELSKASERDPQDLAVWLALIEHQETFVLFASQQEASQSATSSSSRAIAELKISLYQKAISKVKDATHKASLCRGLMREGLKIWDTNQQISEWQKALVQNPSMSLRLDYLSFVEHKALRFSFHECLDLYAGAFTAARKAESSDKYLIHLMLRLTTYLHRAGYTERSIALWQAIIEFNFFEPASVGSSGLATSFGEFWDSEAARIGENNGDGWNRSTHESVVPRTNTPAHRLENEDLWNSWAKSEQDASLIEIMPARTMDNTAEDDPFRIILYSDIQDFMFQLHEIESRTMLIQALLQFCDLPQLQEKLREKLPWNDDASALPAQPSGQLMVPKLMLTEAFTLTAPLDSLFSCFPTQSTWPSPMLDFVMRILSKLVLVFTDCDHFAEYFIAFKANDNFIAAKKLARSLLKTRADRPRLYNMYALIQARAGHFEEAEKLWSTAISMATSFPQSVQQQVIILWESWSWELLNQQQSERAASLLVIALPHQKQDVNSITPNPGQTPLTEHDILHARHYLSTRITTSIQEHATDCTIAYTNLLAILNYLLSDHSLDEALRSYKTTLASLAGSDRYISERIHQSQARLIDLHTRSPTTYRPIQITAALQQSLTLFPNNSIFHMLHATYARKSGQMDRLRSALSLNNTIAPASVQSTILKLASGLSRPLYGSTPHNIRAAFTRATAEYPTPALWKTWLQWELDFLANPDIRFSSRSSAQDKRIKDVYLSSIRACPGIKDLYMVGFLQPELRRILGDHGLEDIYRSMLERGLRIRIDIEEVLDQRGHERDW